jgi:hypothetical protein
MGAVVSCPSLCSLAVEDAARDVRGWVHRQPAPKRLSLILQIEYATTTQRRRPQWTPASTSIDVPHQSRKSSRSKENALEALVLL